MAYGNVNRTFTQTPRTDNVTAYGGVNETFTHLPSTGNVTMFDLANTTTNLDDSRNSSFPPSTTDYYYYYDDYNTELSMYEKVLTWGILPLFILAVFGNILIVIVMNKPRNRILASSVYFTALAVSDLLLVTQVSMERWLSDIMDVSMYKSSTQPEILQAKVAAIYSNIHLSSWILVAITIERTVCVMVPHKVKLVCTPLNAKLIVVTMCVLIVGINLAFMFGVLEIEIIGDKIPIFLPKVTYGTEIFLWMDMICGFLIPFVIIVIGSSIIVMQLLRTRIRKHSSTVSGAASATRILILANITFLITVSPRRILSLVLFFRDIEFTPPA